MTTDNSIISYTPIEWLVARAAATRFVRQVLAEKVDLRAFRQKPTPKVIIGISAIVISYIIGWPLIGLLGILAACYAQPNLLLIGGPSAYGLSHLVFLLGMYLAGARYSWLILRWMTRVAMLRLLKRYPAAMPPVQ